MSERSGVKDKQVLITGATNGIGLAAAKELAAAGAMVAIVARSESKAKFAVAEIQTHAGPDSHEVDVLFADLSSMTETRRVASEVLERYPRLQLLINNAGAIYSKRELTSEGFELTWAINHLSPFLLTNLLLERIKESGGGRIITTSSDAHKGVDIPFDDLTAERSYGRAGLTRYGQTKLANILFTTELARRLSGSDVTASCFHPGVIASGFGQNTGGIVKVATRVIRPFAGSPEKGADTLIWLATSPDVEGERGGYYYRRRRIDPSKQAQSLETAQRLWTVSAEAVGLTNPPAVTDKA